MGGDRFGRALALSAGTLLVGAPWADVDHFFDAGAAYVFVANGASWTQQQKLVATQPASRLQIGAAVAVDGDAALVAGAEDFRPGAALYFERTRGSWTERQRLRAFDAADFDRFGAAVALDGTTAAVGAPGASTANGIESGAVYVLVPASADLALGMTASPASVTQADLVTYTMMVTNSGPDPAPAVGLDLALDPGLFVDGVSTSQGACTATASSVHCALDLLPAGDGASVTVEAVAGAVGTLDARASIAWAGADPVPGNETASASITVSAGGPADVSVSKTGPPRASVDSLLFYTLRVANHGPSRAAGVAVSDPTPPGLIAQYVSAPCSSGFPCLIPRMSSGETHHVSVHFRVPASYPGPNPVVNTATVATSTSDPSVANNTATVHTPFFIPAGNLGFHPLTPCRLLDTRDQSRGGPDPLAADSVRVVSVPGFGFGSCGVPFGTGAIAVNVAVTQPSAPGNLRLYPAGLPPPGIATVNYGAGQTRGNNGVVSLSEEGNLAIKVGQATGTVHVIVDVFGYFQ